MQLLKTAKLCGSFCCFTPLTSPAQVLLAEHAAFKHQLAEPLSLLVQALQAK